MQPIPRNCICLSITIQKAADNWAAQTWAHLSLQKWDGGHKSATPNTACPFGCSFPNPPLAPSSLLCWHWPLTQKPVPAARPETTYSSPLLSPHLGGPLVGTFGETGRASCRKLVRKAAWTPGEPGLQSWQEHRGSQQKEIFLSAHLVQRATHFVFVLKLGSKHSHPKEKYKGILKLQEPISSDKIKLQTSGKLMHEKKKQNQNQPVVWIIHSVQMQLVGQSDLTTLHSSKRTADSFGGGGRKPPSGESAVLDLQADCFSQQGFYIIESVVNL